MPNLFDELWSNSDLVSIVGSRNRTISNSGPPFEKRFHISAGDAETQEPKIAAAVLTFMIRGLAETKQQPVVKVNDREIGVIPLYPDVEGRHWFPEAISIGSGVLAQGDNRIEIGVLQPPDPAAANADDGFQIKDLVCHYRISPSGSTWTST